MSDNDEDVDIFGSSSDEEDIFGSSSGSLIEKERDEVISDVNTAQDEFLIMLDQMDSAHAIEVRFDHPMYGDLDFSVLKDRDFKNIKTLIFDQAGKVTHLRNIPEGITRIICTKQILTILDQLPSTLEELDLTENSLTKFDGKNTPKLKVLRLSNNELMEISHLPSTLKILECNNNQLRRLNLAGTPELKTLHCSNNPLLMIEHQPASIDDFKMDNNPLVEIESANSQSSSRSNNRKLNYLETIKEFFHFKSDYDTKLRKLKRNAFYSVKSKQAGIKKARAVRAPCIYCKRKVGTIFSTQNARYTAICGDKNKPCDLDIQIFNGDYFNINELRASYYRDIVDAKEAIIQQKLHTIFHYVSDDKSVKQFKEELENYNDTSSMYLELQTKYNDLYENPTKKEQISRKQREIYQLQEQIDILKKEYAKTNDKEVLKTMVQTYHQDLVPAVHQLRLLKYDTMMVETNQTNIGWVSTLFQSEVAVHKRDFNYGEEPRVIKYVMN